MLPLPIHTNPLDCQRVLSGMDSVRWQVGLDSPGRRHRDDFHNLTAAQEGKATV